MYNNVHDVISFLHVHVRRSMVFRPRIQPPAFATYIIDWLLWWQLAVLAVSIKYIVYIIYNVIYVSQAHAA